MHPVTGNRRRVLVFGASGAIGQALVSWFDDCGCDVVAVTRSTPVGPVDGKDWVVWNPYEDNEVPHSLSGHFDAVVWSQGRNLNDNIYNFESRVHQEIYRANVEYILITLQLLLNMGFLVKQSRLCIISSIWQNIARQDKLSYTVTKSAINGLVQSLAIDLGKDGHLVNAVLPGALDTPMTRSNLSAEQISCMEQQTPLGMLASIDDVCNLVGFLCSERNTGITGQFIAADRGFSYARIY